MMHHERGGHSGLLAVSPGDPTGPTGGVQVVIEGVRKTYTTGGREVCALELESLTLSAGAWSAVVGHSGSGKTTLLNLIAGLLSPTSGKIVVGTTDITALSPAGRDRFRAGRVGYVFQTLNLLSALSALENVALPMLFSPSIPRRERRERAARLLERVGLGDRFHHRPQELSQGERQRVAMARALANQPRLVLADEPSASLDEQTARAAMDLLLEVCEESGTTLVVATHERGLLGRIERAGMVIDLEQANAALRKEGARR